MAKNRKTKTPPAPSAADLDDLDQPLPAVATLPAPVTGLNWLQRLVLADDLLRHPRRFLLQATGQDPEDFLTQPQARKDRHPLEAMRDVLQAFLPGWSGQPLTSRHLQQMMAESKLGGVAVDDLETAVLRLVNCFIPIADDGPDGEDRWQEKKHALTEHVATIIREIEQEIIHRLRDGQRDERIIATVDLPLDRLFSINSDHGLYWELPEPLWLACIKPGDLPENCPLRQLPIERLPQLDKLGGDPIVILGPQQPTLNPTIPAPRSFYHLSVCESYTRHGFRAWAQRHRTYLEANRDTAEQFQRFEAFDCLMRSPVPARWNYPDAPALPALDGYGPRSLLAIDALRHVTQYVKAPTPGLPLAELLSARRVLVDAVADEAPSVPQTASRSWVTSVFNRSRRDELAESFWALAKSTLEAVEDLDRDFHFEALRDFQQRRYLAKESA